MSLKVAKAEAYVEIEDIPEVRGEDVPRMRKFYRDAFGKETTLSEDDIVNCIAYSPDEQIAEVWADAMQKMERGEVPVFDGD